MNHVQVAMKIHKLKGFYVVTDAELEKRKLSSRVCFEKRTFMIPETFNVQ